MDLLGLFRRKVAFPTCINMLCAISAHGALETVAVLPKPVYIDGGVEFADLEAAYAHLKSRYERTTPSGTGVATVRVIDINPWVNDYNPSYNGIASKYIVEVETCQPAGWCSTKSNGIINVSMRCPESFTPSVANSNGSDRTLHCVNYIPIDKSTSDCDVVGNPILVATGEKIQRETDYRSADGILEFSRTYRSGAAHSISASPATITLIDNSDTFFKPYGCFASFFTEQTSVKKRIPYCFKYVVSPTVSEFHVTVRLESGRKLFFKNSAGAFINLSSTGDRLIKVVNDPAVEWELHSSDGSVMFFNANGQVKRKRSPLGRLTSFSYSTDSTPRDVAPSPGLLIGITDDLGRRLQFKYNGLVQLTTMIDPHGNEFLYTYDEANNITLVTYPGGGSRGYLFAEPDNINDGIACSGSSNFYSGLLTGIVDEMGIRYANYKYDCSGRAISSEHANGTEKTLLTFNSDGSTTVTNALNKQTIYRFDDIAGARRVVKVEGQPTANCAGANQNYTYTNEGWIASKTDWKGIKTTYQYNTLGQEISRTEAEGTPDARTITTEWHPTLYLKTKITEPDKQTIFTYDAQGRLIHQATQSLN